MDRELVDRIEEVQPLEVEGDAHRLIGAAPRAALRVDAHPAPDAGNAGLAEVLDDGAVRRAAPASSTVVTIFAPRSSWNATTPGTPLPARRRAKRPRA